ncbi:mycofactocin system FadH/OYE family oxidoreductase 2 [Rhodococcus sp. X156]|uniref:mycofactocin system FadH/OYE family oxidoreductase 2 n=1 Tax=Rhodococcus sp. X156 TaxID=2499145 RepID=UPI000FD848E7|nr:mycofactocin system FadH/OYE family oxidoreductase 2 [Rhodococcus sp. X156]
MRLFTPLQVGPLALANRVVFTAHLTNAAVDGLPTAQHAAYYAARAAGGAGLVITEEHSVHPSDGAYEKLIRGHDPAVLPGYRLITDAVHAHGVPVLAQLNHNGGQASSLYTRTPVLAPSPVPDPLFREVPTALTHRQIAELVAGYADVAARCVAGGFDGVELQASQSSLLRCFLAPATNTRTDGYGGDLPARARLLLEVVDAVREVLGPDKALGVRLSGHDGIEHGVTLTDAVAVARLVEATGSVDYLNTTLGVATSTQHLITSSMRTPADHAHPVARAIKAAVALPVIGVGRFTRPEQAEQALADGVCDLVGVVRAQVADPDFATKARTGRAAEIRSCLSCNQECVGRVGLNRWLGCVVNPHAGRESVPLPAPVRRARRVVVVGGGPGGLRAAATAAERGHRVTLHERADRLGGQVLLAASAPGRAQLGAVTADLAAECARRGVQVHTGSEVSAAQLLAEGPEVVVLATGARPVRQAWAGECPRVVHVRDVLAGRVRPTGTVLVHDELGFHQAPSAAEALAARGCAVTVSTSAMVVAQDLGLTLDTEGWQRRAHAAGIDQRTDLVPRGVAEQDGRLAVTLLHHPTGAESVCVVDWVVCAVHQEPEDELWRALAGSGLPVHRVGDCLTPRRLHAAVLEGERVALAL